MKLLGDGVATVKKAAAAVAARVLPAPRTAVDPFRSDLERRAAINARRVPGGRDRWLGPRRPGWLRIRGGD